MLNSLLYRVLLIPIIYFVISAVYIIFSDLFLLTFIKDINIYREIQTFKGWGFISLSALLIYFLVRNLINKLEVEYNHEIALKNELSTKEANYYELFKNNPMPMWIYDIKTLKFLEVNDAAINHYGFTKSEFLNMTIKDIRPPEDFTKLLIDIENNSDKISRSNTWRHLKKNGDLIFVEVKSHSLKYQGKDARNVMIYDITEKLLLNNDLIAAKIKAEESDKLKSALIQNISHEIRTPLNGILGLSNLIIDDKISKSERQEFTDLIKKSSNRLIITIENLIELSKIQSGDTKVNKVIAHVNTIINELYDTYIDQCKYQHVELINEKAMDDDNCFILVDDKKLYHIFDILINNAVKFTLKGNIKFGYYVEGNYLIGYVIDTGIGIDDKYKDQIFETFFQIENSISRRFEGSGVGLAIVKAFINLLNGKIWLESQLGIGSKFYFKIPVKR